MVFTPSELTRVPNKTWRRASHPGQSLPSAGYDCDDSDKREEKEILGAEILLLPRPHTHHAETWEFTERLVDGEVQSPHTQYLMISEKQTTNCHQEQCTTVHGLQPFHSLSTLSRVFPCIHFSSSIHREIGSIF